MPTVTDDADDWADRIAHAADRMGLEGKGRERYIDEHMTAGGYKRVTTYERDSGDDGDGDGGNDADFGTRYGRKAQGKPGADDKSRGRGKPAGKPRNGGGDWYNE